MTVASQRAGWSRLPLRAAAFVVLTCVTILGVSGWREGPRAMPVLKGAETEMANVARSLTQHAEDSLDLLNSGVVGVVSRLEMDGAEPTTIDKLATSWRRARRRSRASTASPSSTTRATGDLAGHDRLDPQRRRFFRHHQLSPSASPHSAIRCGASRRRMGRHPVAPLQQAGGSFGGVVLATISSNISSHFYEQFESAAIAPSR